MRTVAVLGQGYVGTHVSQYLNQRGIDTLALSRDFLNYTDYYTFNNLIKTSQVNYVINCAGFTGRPNIDEAEIKQSECWKANVSDPVSINRICREHNINYIHVSSGCIYNGYSKEFTEQDTPNFGLFDNSSVYSKTKHAYELTAGDYGMTVRIRLPFCSIVHPRSLLTKLINYNTLFNYQNSKTYLPDFAKFLNFIVSNNVTTASVGILNFTNPHPLFTSEIVSILKGKNIKNDDWVFKDLYDESRADTSTRSVPRANCILSTAKLQSLYPTFNIKSETDAIVESIEMVL